MLQTIKNTITKEVIETINMLTTYAKEDISLLKEEGAISDVDTELGCLDLTYDNINLNRKFSAISRKRNSLGKIEITNLLSEATEKQLTELLITSYIIEA